MKKTPIHGAVYVEFLVVFWPLMLLWLGLTQIGLLYGVHIMVNHAAAKAARAAIVIFPDEEDRYQGDERLSILQDANSEDVSLKAYKKAQRGGRLDTIRKAARIPLATVSPSLDISANNAMVDLIAGWMWTEYAVAVTFPDGNGNFLTKFDQTGPLTTRVTYLYKCPVPLISRIMCHRYWRSGNSIQKDSQGNITGQISSNNSGINSEAMKILDTVDASVLGGVGMGIELGIDKEESWRFLVVEAMRTLPMQGQHK
jgi:hypothetical protein